jgi:hypothetical protein
MVNNALEASPVYYQLRQAYSIAPVPPQTNPRVGRARQKTFAGTT